MQHHPDDIPTRTILWLLFRSTFKLSAFTFGGGYVIVPLMRKLFVETYRWLDEQEMLDLIAIGQAAPGVIAVNTSIILGYKIRGVPGALITLLGTISPPLIILSVISLVYTSLIGNPLVEALFAGMRVGVSIVILDAVVSMARNVIKKKSAIAIGLMIVSFLLVTVFDVGVIIIIVACAAVGLLLQLKRHDSGATK
jgi:chromate transporter